MLSTFNNVGPVEVTTLKRLTEGHPDHLLFILELWILSLELWMLPLELWMLSLKLFESTVESQRIILE
jgi:hypothetical protein